MMTLRQAVAGETGAPASASMRYGIAEAESLWLAHYGRAANARKIASELDAVFHISEKDGGDYLLRITDNRDGIADLQAAVLEHIAATAPTLSVPIVHRSCAGNAVTVLPATQGTQLAAFATSFLPGRPLAALAPSPAMRSRVFELLALLDRSLEGFSHPSARRSLLWDVSNADQVVPLIGAIPDSLLRDLAQRAIEDWRAHALPALRGLRRQVVHNDFNPSNILATEDGVIRGIIDFGDVVDAPLICDLATAIAYQEPEGGFETLLAAAVEAYHRDYPLTDEEIAILPVLVRARAAMVAAITNWRAAQNPANRDYLLRNLPLASRLLESAA